jgi:hypothetical protein
MYVCMYVCMYIYTHTHTYTHTYIHKHKYMYIRTQVAKPPPPPARENFIEKNAKISDLRSGDLRTEHVRVVVAERYVMYVCV